MMLHRSKEESSKFVSNPGSRWYTEKHGEVQPDGTIKLVEDKVVDIQERMNAEYPMTTIENILANCNPDDYFGDDGLHSVDAINIPKTLAEFMQLQINLKRDFDRLPLETRAKFNNNFNEYLATAGSEDWFTKVGVEISGSKQDVREESSTSVKIEE